MNFSAVGNLLQQPQVADSAVDGDRQTRSQHITGAEPVTDPRELRVESRHDLPDCRRGDFDFSQAARCVAEQGRNEDFNHGCVRSLLRLKPAVTRRPVYFAALRRISWSTRGGDIGNWCIRTPTAR